MAMMAAGVLAWGLDKYEAIPRIPFTEGSVESVAEPGEPANWLLVGTDTRDGIDESDPNADKFLGDGPIGGVRTDTMIIARVDPETRTVDLLSIPRDLYVPIAGTDRESRINTAFNGEGGAQRLVDTIESNLGIEINHYAEINFVGFQDVVDTLGGVPIWFDRPMRDTGSGLDVAAGCHVLGGSQALAFARSRNLEFFENGRWQLDGTGDLGRTSRQQYFLSRVAAVAASKLDVTSIGTVNSILDVGGDNLALDQAVSAQDLLDLATIFASVEEGQITGHALPVYDFRAPNNAAVLGLVEEEATPILNIFRGIEPEVDEAGTAVPTTTGVPSFQMRVLNGSRVAGQAGEVTSELGTRGFQISEKSNAETTARTKIVYGPGLEAAAESVALHLEVEPVFELDTAATDVALITGTDFDGLRDEPLPAGSVAAPTTTAPPTTAPPAVDEAPTTTAPIVGVVPGPSPEGTECA